MAEFSENICTKPAENINDDDLETAEESAPHQVLVVKTDDDKEESLSDESKKCDDVEIDLLEKSIGEDIEISESDLSSLHTGDNSINDSDEKLKKHKGKRKRGTDDDGDEWLPERRSRRLQKKTETKLAERKRLQDLGLVRKELYWKEFEKKNLLSACKEFGTKDWEKIVDKVPTKPAEMVKKFIVKEKRNQNYTVKTEFVKDDGEVVTIDDGEGGRRKTSSVGPIDLADAKPQGRIVEVTKRRERNAPIEQWLGILEARHGAEEKKLREAGFEQAGDYSSVMPNMLRWVAEMEPQPDPEECGGVDYAAIYRWLALLCEGEAPPDLDRASSLRVSRLLPMLVTILEGMDLSRETEYLSNYRGPFTKYRWSEGFNYNSKEAKNMDELSRVPGMNPLGLHLEMLAGREVPSLTKMMEMFSEEAVEGSQEEESGKEESTEDLSTSQENTVESDAALNPS